MLIMLTYTALHNENAKYCYGDDGYDSTSFFFAVRLPPLLLHNEIWVFVISALVDAFPLFIVIH